MTAALCVMDVQVGILSRYADDPGLVPRLVRATQAARAAAIPVIYVVVGFRSGHPEVSARNQGFAGLAASGAFAEGDPNAEIAPEVAPGPGDVVVTKRRVSAFAGSDFETVLRSQGVDTLVLTGIATSGVVLSTLRQAADLDFGLVVLSDGCADGEAEVHQVLTEKVFPRQAQVTTIDDWIAGLSS